MSQKPANDFTADAEIRLNDNVVQMRGKGSINITEGVVTGGYRIEKLPPRVDPFLFKCVMVTGYPSVCRVAQGANNPFHFGDYGYRREIEFGNRGRLSYDAECQFKSIDGRQVLVSRFEVIGDVDVPALNSAEPIIETWIPNGPETIGTFTIAWKARDSYEYVVGHAKTVYRIPTGATQLNHVAHRRIVFSRASKTSTCLHLTQESTLLSS